MNWRFPINRRYFLKSAGGALSATSLGVVGSRHSAIAASADPGRAVFPATDSLYHGEDWESLNPGYWQVRDGALRRRFHHYGERARRTGFPYHYETHRINEGVMDRDYDPSLPPGTLYRREWKLSGAWSLRTRFTYHGTAEVRREGDSDDWAMYQPGYGMLGLAFGAKSLFESYHTMRHARLVGWTDDGRFGFLEKGRNEAVTAEAPALTPGDNVEIVLSARPEGGKTLLTAVLTAPSGKKASISLSLPPRQAEGYVGIAARGLADFEVNEWQLDPGENEPLSPAAIDCLTCYPLGDTLAEDNAAWTVRFVALFASAGERAEVRIADSPTPEGGWEQVPAAGLADIVNHEWRRHTASILASLPADPSSTTLYYTVWKDGMNVTADPRLGTDATGPGTGYVGDVPASGDYVGRLPRLAAPYKICGLSCHAINSGLQQRTGEGLKILGGGDEWQIRDQPTVEAYRHFDDYGFQILCWEDDVWYMELVLYPPSTDDAYKVVTTTICGPTTRWQMMRHWNVINPGDHDYGMDDVKGPEQILIRNRGDLGQDPDYMRRNFQIVHHLVTGDEKADPLENPKRWRAWKMPQRDFTFVVLDARLWRSSQDTAIWTGEGWGHDRELYSRTDPTRALLGEEQFAWLQQLVRTDSSPLICLTGLNGLHTVWTGGRRYSNTDGQFDERDRVAADYAGWVAAGADRVLELLGSREGVVTVYGDVHNGCLMKNREQRVVECSFGPIGRSGGRAVIEGFGPVMEDHDGRPLEVAALYHKEHADPQLNEHPTGAPFYWNFLEMEFDPRPANSTIGLRLRNMIDPPDESPRGGGALEIPASETGRIPSSRLPELRTLPHADVRVVSVEGLPLRGMRSDAEGRVGGTPLADVPAGTKVIVTSYDGMRSSSQTATTV